MRPTHRADLLTRVIKDEVVILDRQRGQVHHLNVTASYIWNQCDGASAPDAIAHGLAAAFGRKQHEVVSDVATTLHRFYELGLLGP